MMSCGQVPSLSYSQATLRMSFSAKLWASSRRSFCSSVSVKSTTWRAPLKLIDWSVSQGPRVADLRCGLARFRLNRVLLGVSSGVTLIVVFVIAVPIAALLFAGSSKALDDFGKGPFAMDSDI